MKRPADSIHCIQSACDINKDGRIDRSTEQGRSGC